MALRQHVFDVIKLSNVFNSLAIERGAISRVTAVCKKTYQHKPFETKGHQGFLSSLDKSQALSTNTNPAIFALGTDLLKTSQRDSVVQDEYKCPSSLTHKFSQLVILDQQINKSDYHLPLGNPVTTSLIDPSSRHHPADVVDPLPLQHTPAKEAKEILKIRHKKMKKHKLKKLRKRMYFLWRKQKMIRRSKRDVIYWKEIEDIKKEGEDFDAESFVKEELQKARRGGYYMNVFASKV